MGREARMRKIRQQIGYKPNTLPGKEARKYDIVPRTRPLFRRLLIEGKRVMTKVGDYQTGQRFCTGTRKLYRHMKQVDAQLRRQT